MLAEMTPWPLVEPREPWTPEAQGELAEMRAHRLAPRRDRAQGETPRRHPPRATPREAARDRAETQARVATEVRLSARAREAAEVRGEAKTRPAVRSPAEARARVGVAAAQRAAARRRRPKRAMRAGVVAIWQDGKTRDRAAADSLSCFSSPAYSHVPADATSEVRVSFQRDAQTRKSSIWMRVR